MTPHNRAKPGDFAKVVLMPGDPLRAKWIAETFLTKAKLVTDVRGMFGYTGTYKGKKISVMGSGMGMPSIGIYSYELFNDYGVSTIIRIGTCGSYQEFVQPKDVVVATEAYSHSTYATPWGIKGDSILKATPKVAKIAIAKAKELKKKIHTGIINSNDTFYGEAELIKGFQKKGYLGVEMEAFALYANAKVLKKQALTICTVSDSLVGHKYNMTPAERQSSVKDMVHIALETALELLK